MPTTQPVFFNHHVPTYDDMLSPYVWCFYASFLAAYVFTPVMRSIAIYYGIIDKPDLVRKLHREPVAYLGGLAVFMGWLAGLTMSQFSAMHVIEPTLDDRLRVPLAIVAAAFIIVILGLWDDVNHIRPRVKIVGQALAGVVLLAAGIGIDITGFFVNNVVIRVEPRLGIDVPDVVAQWTIWTTSAALTLGLIVFCCNASNLMDGLDGLCGGVTAIIAAGFVFLAVVIGTQIGIFSDRDALADRVNMDALRVVIALALLGGVMGFIPYNFNPASIFMGDTGSMFLGFACALLMILLGSVDGKWLLAGMVMFALPVLDTSLAFARRFVAGRPFFSPDRHHFHHQLVQRGLSVKQAVLVSYALTTFFVVCGILIVYMRTRYAVGFYMVLFGCVIVAAYKMGMVHERVVVEKAGKIGESGSEVTGEAITTEGGVLEIRKQKPVIDL
jgi:UDP-GlcNAc:undecaprenyl-phosphate/decaprenyl-phosphate GlcNAc-1-phosphate transferase